MSEVPSTDAAAAAPAAPAAPKIFVGNLSFTTTAEHLKTAFSDFGAVKSANIITRGVRSLGYGFVEMEDDSVADKCVAEMDKKEIDGRTINVEFAKPRDEVKAKASAPGGRGGRARTGSAGPGRGRGGRGRGRGRGGRGGRGRGGRPSIENDANRVESKTDLFVANLPYSVDDDGLSEIFKDFKITSARVVKKKNGRSKGFGFVKCADEDSQGAAIAAINNKLVDSRELIVKIALKSEIEGEGEGEGQGNAEGDQATPAEETPAAPAESS